MNRRTELADRLERHIWHLAEATDLTADHQVLVTEHQQLSLPG
ncbi:hypothetical protein AB0J28_21970 [Streptosporangium canum]